MSRETLFSVVLVLLLCSCTLAVGHVGSVRWTNWAIWPVRQDWTEPRWAYQGTPDEQYQWIGGEQSAHAWYGPSGIGQITIAAGEQFQNATDTAIQQHQSGTMLVGQMAGTIGAGRAWGSQDFDAYQYQAASSAVGQSTQTSSIGVTQFSNVFGAPDSKAFAGGMVVVSTAQTQYVN